MPYEIEYKYRITNKDDFTSRLNELNISLLEFVYQEDIIFMHKNKCFNNLNEGEPIVRIRTDSNGISTNVKKYVQNCQVRQEVECKIVDKDLFIEYLKLLGFSKLVVVKKHRAYTKLDGLTITYDIVEQLGDFVEIEIVTDNHDISLSKTIISNMGKKLGLDNKDIVNLPYDEMIYLKGLNKND